jgi:hypothetical protein
MHRTAEAAEKPRRSRQTPTLEAAGVETAGYNEGHEVQLRTLSFPSVCGAEAELADREVVAMARDVVSGLESVSAGAGRARE